MTNNSLDPDTAIKIYYNYMTFRGVSAMRLVSPTKFNKGRWTPRMTLFLMTVLSTVTDSTKNCLAVDFRAQHQHRQRLRPRVNFGANLRNESNNHPCSSCRRRCCHLPTALVVYRPITLFRAQLTTHRQHHSWKSAENYNDASSRRYPLFMSLIPIPVNDLREILPSPLGKLTPTGDQYVTYLGKTPQQRFNSMFEGASIAFLGSMFAYFISFVIGQFLATLMGIIFVFWPILSPEFKAYQRNWELVGGRDLIDVWMDVDDDISDDDIGGTFEIPEDKRGLYGAYYVARIVDVCVVDDVRAASDEEYDLSEFQGYTMASDELENLTGIPWKLRVRLSDDKGRGMQVHSRMSEEYLGIKPGMGAVGVVLSTSRKFDKLAGLTDFCVFSGDFPVWIGDYPYLDKDNFINKLNENGIADSALFNIEGDDFAEGEAEDDFAFNGGKEEYINLK